MKKILVLLPFIALMAACSDSAQTKDWYKQHDSERKTRVAECRNDVKLRVSADCENALSAQAEVSVFGK
ncbi:EexN family lipoprotein [Pseudomonas savastanoi]|uniref:EexN family lipoprotein n=1 Tax=Pseudomonas savastanoi TaxID=29438 RepID=UPI000E3285DE|nr:EexN family lipoprotein [Pseudomonas savastanoi]